jgi:hypothetical protein
MKTPKRKLRDALAAAADVGADENFDFDTAAPSDEGPGRRGVLVRVSPALRRQLKIEAIPRDTTVQDLLLEAIAVVLQRSRQAPNP